MKKVKKFVKNNIKLLIGIMIGLAIAGSIGVYAATVINASSVSFSGSTSGLTSTNMQDALNEAYNNCKTKCPAGYICKEAPNFKIGDYVSMTPTSTSYTTDTSMTGYTSTQTINPSELNLWRIIRINSDGTMEIVSEYVSSINVYFRGKIGYQNLVGYLNTIAKQYENSNYTISSRHMGYSTQTPYITDTSAFTSSFQAPQTESTSSSNVTSATEAKGLGDMGYETDYNLVNTVLGTLEAYQVGTTTGTFYWIASRNYEYNNSLRWYFHGRIVNDSGVLAMSSLYYNNGGTFNTSNRSMAVRPILTLKSGVKAFSGDGSSSSPYILS